MNSTLMNTLMKTTPATRLSCHVAAAPHASLHSAFTAPNAGVQGTGLSFAGTSYLTAAVAEVAVAGVRTIDLPGSPPRGAPV